jgi:hypothetical protein
MSHLWMGAVQWSPKLQSFCTAIEIWTLLLKKRKGTRSISNQKLRRLLAITDAFDKTIPKLEDALTQAFADYKEAKDQALPWQDEFLETLASNRASAKGMWTRTLNYPNYERLKSNAKLLET